MKQWAGLQTILAIAVFSGAPTCWCADLQVPSEHSTIQSAVNAALDGDTVTVADAIYMGPGNRDIDPHGKRLLIRSVNGPDATVIDCQGSADDPHRGFRFTNSEDSTTALTGFTIRNGYAPRDNPRRESYGGAIFIDSASSPVILRCIFAENTADHAGGGIYCGTGCSPIISECEFAANSAHDKYLVSLAGLGGGLRAFESSPSLEKCSFIGNVANIGAGVSGTRSQISFDSCTFRDNTADAASAFEPIAPGAGGGVHLYESPAELRYCMFISNRALPVGGSDADGGVGGALVTILSDSVRLSHCTLYKNAAVRFNDTWRGRGGGIYCKSSLLSIQNCIISHSSDGAAIYCGVVPSPPSVACSDFFNNAGGDWTGCVADQGIASGNFSADPLYCDQEDGLLGLRDDSPCLPENNSCGLPVGGKGAECSGITLGDVDGDGRVALEDVVYLVNYLFKRGPVPEPLWTADANCDGAVALIDVVLIVNYLFRAGEAPACS